MSPGPSEQSSPVPFTILHRARSYPATALGVLGVIARNRPLSRIQAAFAVFNSAEWATWLAMLVFAYANGGATEASIVSLVQLVPCAVLAPVAASIGDRHLPGRALVASYGLQALACGLGALALGSDIPKNVVYILLIPASVSFTLTRPLHSAFAPALARSPEELTATNVTSGLIVGLSIFVAPALGGIILALSSPAVVFGVMGVGCAVGAVIVWPLRDRVGRNEAREGEPPGSFMIGLKAVTRDRPVRMLVALLAAQGFLIGALDVLYVELAQGVLGLGGQWAGYLSAAFGAGGALAVLVTATLVGRPRLGPPLALAVVVSAAALLGVPAMSGPAGMMVMLLLVGGSLSTFEVAARTLLQRSAPTDLLGQVFGLVEGLGAATLAVGAGVAGALIALGGATFCAVGLALVLPLVAALFGRQLLEIDRHADVPVTEIGLLRSMSLFASLPPPTLELLARALDRCDVPPNTPVIRQGDSGDLFYAIAEGEVEVVRDGEAVASLGRGDGFGELALLLNRPRNATVRTLTRARLYTLSHDHFVPVLTGHPRASAAGDDLVRRRLEPDATLTDTTLL